MNRAILMIAAAASLFVSSAYAKDITITLNDNEQKVFLALLDSAVKQGGLNSLQSVVTFVQKYQAALQSSQATPEPSPLAPNLPADTHSEKK